MSYLIVVILPSLKVNITVHVFWSYVFRLCMCMETVKGFLHNVRCLQQIILRLFEFTYVSVLSWLCAYYSYVICNAMSLKNVNENIYNHNDIA